MNQNDILTKGQIRIKQKKAKKIITAIIGISIFTLSIALIIIPKSNKEVKINETKSEPNSYGTVSRINRDKISKETCTICGKEFIGKGYKEVSNGLWKLCEDPYQCFICSPSCGLRHTNKMNSYIDDTNNKGRVPGDECSKCNGTGIENILKPNTVEKEGRKCITCDGKGHIEY